MPIKVNSKKEDKIRFLNIFNSSSFKVYIRNLMKKWHP